jgi:hypothetical protein
MLLIEISQRLRVACYIIIYSDTQPNQSSTENTVLFHSLILQNLTLHPTNEESVPVRQARVDDTARQAYPLTASRPLAPQHQTQSCKVRKYHEEPTQLAKNPARNHQTPSETHRQPILLVNGLIVLPSKHIAEMPDRRIMHDRNLIPPFLRLLPLAA